MARCVTRFYFNGKPIAKKFIKNRFVLNEVDYLKGMVNPVIEKGSCNFRLSDGGNLKVVVSYQRNKR